ncbi:hypothetical protein V757_03120 [Pelistega indica]|uniref:Glycosyl transferase family 1 domain-containing protein n=1 Tax=Pelistega indica TaxID=1414851 RepID=V8G9N7_9BURK|nr:glycosyltransferase [Pelistega indica]ETD72653.1 hypothetical protein V757_03120 [Pelistega indica]
MKLLYCIPRLDTSGGIERVVVNKINYYVQECGYEVTVVTYRQQNRENFFKLDSRVRQINLDAPYPISYEQLSFFKRIIPFRKVNAYLMTKLNQIVSETAFDYCISILMDDIAIIPKLTDSSIKVGECHGILNEIVYCYRHSETFFQKLKWFLRLKKFHFFSKKFDVLVFLTQEESKLLNYSIPLEIIPNFIVCTPLNDEFFQFNNSKTAVSAGHLIPLKGHARLLDAWRLVVDKCSDAHLDIYGSGSEEETLLLKIRELKLTDNVTIKKPLKDLENHYGRYSLTLLASYYEGFSMVCLESLAKAVPVIAYNVPCGLQHILKGNNGGVLVEDDNANAFSAAVIELLESRELQRKQKQKAFSRAKDYNIEIIMHQWQKLFFKI